MSIKSVLMRRDGLTAEEADDLIADAKAELSELLADGEQPYDFCQDWFGLEPDYLMELL